jgi:alpha-beta hydrolase superfamily lysophospholipase
LRGEADFSAARLRSQLRPWSNAPDAAPPPELEAFRRFYGFTNECEHRIGTLESCGQSIVVQGFRPERPVATALVIHGYYDHIGLYVHLIEHLLSRNVAVVGCDLPGHGLSSGDRVTIDSFDTYVHVVRDVLRSTVQSAPQLFPVPLHLLGQSMGGAIAMELEEQLSSEKGGSGPFLSLTLIAPLVYPWNWKLNRWVYRLAKLFVKTRPRGRSNPTDRPDFRKLRDVDPLQAAILPLSWVTALVKWASRFERYPARKDLKPLVLQGLADTVVDWPYNLDVIRRRYSPVIFEIEGATHHLVNESVEVRGRMWNWIDEHIKWQGGT